MQTGFDSLGLNADLTRNLATLGTAQAVASNLANRSSEPEPAEPTQLT